MIIFMIMLFFVRITEGFSASDLKALASDASLGPIRGTCTCRVKLYNHLTHFILVCCQFCRA